MFEEKSKSKSKKISNREENITYKYAIYAGITIYSVLFVLSLPLAFFIENEILLSLIVFIPAVFVWFKISYMTLDKIRKLTKRIKIYKVLFMIWVTQVIFSVIIMLIINVAKGRPFYTYFESAISPVMFIYLWIIEFFYKKSRKIK